MTKQYRRLVGYVTNEFDSLLIADPMDAEEAADAWMAGVDGRHRGQMLETRQDGRLVGGAVVAPTQSPQWLFGVYVVSDEAGDIIRIEIEPAEVERPILGEERAAVLPRELDPNDLEA